MEQSFEAYLGLSVAATAVAAALVLQPGWLSSIAAAVLVFVSLGFYTRADSIASDRGKSSRVKLGLGFAPFLIELLLLGAVLSRSVVPGSIGAATISVVAMLEVLRLNILSDMKKVIQPAIGRNWRMVILSITFFLSRLNPFYLFYGVAAVGAVAAYDLVEMLYRALYY